MNDSGKKKTIVERIKKNESGMNQEENDSGKNQEGSPKQSRRKPETKVW